MDVKKLKDKLREPEGIKNFVQKSISFQEDLEIIKYINSGSCGIVWEGQDKKYNRNVALKFIINKINEEKRERREQHQLKEYHRQKLLSQKEKELNRKEFNLQRKLKHKNITTIYGIYDIDGSCSCLVMELGRYGDLNNFHNNLLGKKTLSETLLAYFTNQILNGLHYCHKSKIIHMDIKHQNILIDKNLNVKLADLSVSFSYANYKDDELVSLPLAGTSPFMSPEILERKSIKALDCNKVDMFSLGTLLFNLCYRKYPYDLEIKDKNNFDEIKEKIKRNELLFPESTNRSETFKSFLSKLLSKHLSQRYSIEEAMKDKWMKAAQHIFLEKEKIGNLEKFLINMLSDNIKSFNDEITKYS
jgi:serine/threonine protein kinase